MERILRIRIQKLTVLPRLKHILPTPSTAFSKECEDEDSHHKQSNEEEEIEKKSKIDAIWAQLNAGTTPKPTSAETTAPRRITPSQPSNTSVSTAQGLQKEEKEVGGDKVDVRAAAKAALQALKQQEDGLAPGQVYVKEMRRFAGQKVELQKAVEAGSTELEEGLNKKRKTSNLGSVLEQLGAGKKITVVDKSRYDWEGYKKDEKLDEELDTYKKSSNKYLDKVHFLKEAEYKEYERERDMKLKSDVRNRGRL